MYTKDEKTGYINECFNMLSSRMELQIKIVIPAGAMEEDVTFGLIVKSG
jgi:hypothetical protein